MTLRNAANGSTSATTGGRSSPATTSRTAGSSSSSSSWSRRPTAPSLLRYAGYETDESWFGAEHVRDGRRRRHAQRSAPDRRPPRPTSARRSSAAASTTPSRRPRRADAAVVVVGSMPFINGREDHDRTDHGPRRGPGGAGQGRAGGQPEHGRGAARTATRPPSTGSRSNVPAHPVDHPRGRRDRARPRRRALRRPQPGRPAHPDLVPLGPPTAAGPPRLRHHQVRTGPTCTTRATPLYPFGHGLSYTTFPVRPAACRRPVGRGRRHRHGQRRRDQHRQPGRRRGRPALHPPAHLAGQAAVKQLRGVPAGAPRARADPDGDAARCPPPTWRTGTSPADRWVVESSTHDLLVGASVGGHPAPGHGAGRAARRSRPGTCRRPTRAENFDDYAGVRLVDETKARRYAVGATAAGQWISFDGSALRARRAHLHRECRQGRRGRRHHPGPPRIAHRPAARHGHRAQHRRRLPVRQHQHRVGPGRRHAATCTWCSTPRCGWRTSPSGDRRPGPGRSSTRPRNGWLVSSPCRSASVCWACRWTRRGTRTWCSRRRRVCRCRRRCGR